MGVAADYFRPYLLALVPLMLLLYLLIWIILSAVSPGYLIWKKLAFFKGDLES